MNQNYVLSSLLTDNHYLVRQRAREAYKKFSKTYARGKLLDIGCGQKPMEAFFRGTVAVHLARGPLRYGVDAIKVVNNMICLKLDRWHKVEKFTWMYLVIAQKPAGVLK